ncbi:DNA/RNA nuclease SfsA [Algirhabdus cladophorae]|uniref:DNA/RNA nuclease SfsA n=1 Tax=Algirhabdus cladophorae TaxID=3377108 RepID=UPI003B848CB8
MRFQTPLIPGTLIRRYMRFLSEVELETGDVVRAHCPNPGSMLGMKDAGLRVWLEPNDDPKKKLNYGWRLIEYPDGTWAGIDTSLPNKLVKTALADKAIPELAAYPSIKPEQKYGQNSRVDFLLQGPDLPDAYVEVKSVTLSRKTGLAEFPDSVTDRGAKHLAELAQVAAAGHRAILFYVVQRTGCTHVQVASDIDPAYASAYAAARQAGVEVIAYATQIDQFGVSLTHPLEHLDPLA